ncbi:phage holin [Bifidobacterium bifidum]|uniref:phage holin n=2 Tax=Bifidobacterium bifidum TaxID=1681 RepID=UPI0034A1C54A
MANTTGVADHKATGPAIPGLTVERTKAIILLIVQLFSVAQTGLSIAGISQLPFTTDQVSTAITGVIAVIASVYAWWRNNNLTGAAVQGQQLTDALKANIVATATDTDATADATTGTAQAAYAVSDSKGADATADVAPIEEVSYGDGE